MGKFHNVFCALFGHSKIVSMCWGYVSCGRCGQQLGDKLCGAYDTEDKVVIGHNCDICRANYKKLRLRDKLFCQNPFKEEE